MYDIILPKLLLRALVPDSSNGRNVYDIVLLRWASTYPTILLRLLFGGVVAGNRREAMYMT